MKQLGLLMPILLLLGVGIISGLAVGELTASQKVEPPSAAVGVTAKVMLTLSYSGGDVIPVTVTADLPQYVVTDAPGPRAANLSIGSQTISYPIRAEMSGTYWITSCISYTENGPRELRIAAPFTATSGPSTGGSDQPGNELEREGNTSLLSEGTPMTLINATNSTGDMPSQETLLGFPSEQSA